MSELLHLMQDEKENRRDELVALYITALDANDFENAFSVLEAAADDAELDCLINEINQDYERELREQPFAEDAAKVRKLLEIHLASANAAAELSPKSVTLGDVARQMEAKGKVLSQDTVANQQLLQEIMPLPKKLNLPEIKRVISELKIKASEKFFRVFHETAILLEMRQGHQLGLQAAREKRIRRHREKNTDQKTESQLEAKFIEDFDGRDDETNN